MSHAGLVVVGHVSDIQLGKFGYRNFVVAGTNPDLEAFRLYTFICLSIATKLETSREFESRCTLERPQRPLEHSQEAFEGDQTNPRRRQWSGLLSRTAFVTTTLARRSLNFRCGPSIAFLKRQADELFPISEIQKH